MHVVNHCFFLKGSHIGTLVVVYNRSVIEIQSHVRLVVAKGITPECLALNKVVGQKQCLPAPQNCFILFESASCKNSETSWLESRRKFDGVKSITAVKIRYACFLARLLARTVLYLQGSWMAQERHRKPGGG